MRAPLAAAGFEAGSQDAGLLVSVVSADAVRQADMAARVALAGHTVLESGADPADDAVAAVVLWDGTGIVGTERPVLLLGHGTDGRSVLPPDLTPTQLDAGLRAVAAGLRVRIEDAGRREFLPAEQPRALLTPREVEILRCLGDGMSNKAVARALGISAHTVKFHLEAVFTKLDAASRAEAVAKGLRRGLILL